MRTIWPRAERAWQRRGHERNSLVQVVKGLSATLASYTLALHVLDSQIPSFAPFAALLVVQVSVYRSVLHAVRYVGAVVVGLVCAGAIGQTLGHGLGALALLVFLTLVIGQWPRLGDFGSQVAIVGVFTFGVGGGDDPNYLASLLVTVLCGAMMGAAVNVVLAPPIRFNDAAGAVDDLARSIGDLLNDIAAGLRSDNPFGHLDHWRDHADRLSNTVERARSELSFGEENVRLNPRRLGKGRHLFVDYRRAVEALGRTTGNLQSMIRALDYADRYDEPEIDHDLLADFLPRYADLLEKVADVAYAFGQRRSEDQPPSLDLAAAMESAQRLHDQLTRYVHQLQPRDSRTLTDCGALLVETERALEPIRESWQFTSGS
ncbi:hypothetical protein EF847_03080 [Actinobacteria bacterium YIM 96077]|uniref:FUSC family protein n=1 Tax=Phytoactinopolyspora halophila TaxID=1981511 RepID=A0A329R4S0_9ACTN|nr:aromatic acid exporter family protein [Phytoactinopolyspora halophila]AYY11852.1 hypothetical protein EF847_03080 [Actinobacteria bacterium YIM 96077]RAW18916.1 hypothetical protein DPM12_02425 [Phytoactinopolyspora halophila]